jgi:hypothetical protein
MERTKLENQFKHKLANREIKPSDAAWDRLDAMLSTTESDASSSTTKSVWTKTQHKLKWLYAAACITGLLFVGNLLFDSTEKSITIPQNSIVVETNTEKISTNKSKDTESKAVNTATASTEKSKQTQDLSMTTSKQRADNNRLAPQENKVSEPVVAIATEPILINEKVQSENVETLLALIDVKSNSNSSSIKINPTTLLKQVDGELQLTFREKAFNTISKKYQETREALVNRNNQ